MDSSRVDVTQFRRGDMSPKSGKRDVIGEAPLTIDVKGRPPLTIMRTPGADRPLVVGFLFSDGAIEGVADILTLAECPDDPNTIRVRLREGVAPGVERRSAVGSSCGLCGLGGQGGVEKLVAALGPLEEGDGLQVPVDVLYRLPHEVRSRQELFGRTGASHAAALFDGGGDIGIVHEDIGRHNALDKVLGEALLTGTPTCDKGLFLSGRVSLEMVVKAARARVGLVAAVSAPSSLAVETARRLGITVCGFVRGDEVVAYTHEHRILEGEAR